MTNLLLKYPGILFTLCAYFLLSCQQGSEKHSAGIQRPAENSGIQDAGEAKPSNRTIVAFGSCSKQYIPNQRWTDILKQDPDIWIWLGDNIYGDTHDMDVMKEKYADQKSDTGYQMLLRSQVKIIGTWDDHDYGVNDGGRYYSKKEESKKLFMDFLDIPPDHPINDHDGVYQSYEYTFDDHLLQIILLDTRYFRDTIYRNPLTRAYMPNEKGDMLGEQQWQWLEQKLNESTADMILIGSSIQVIPEEQIYEKWANLPAARKRLFNLLQKYPDKRVVFISGDRHIAEISEIYLDGLEYPLYDFTSSGLTHTWSRKGMEPNKYRVSDFIIYLNYGLIIIDWEEEKPHKITFQIKGEGDTLLSEFKPMLFDS
jgi:alkaline phosphatase D